MVAESVVDLMTGWVTGWIDEQDPVWLQQQIAAEANLAPALMQKYPPVARRFARGYLGDAMVRGLQQAGDAEWQAVVDALCQTRPQWGMAFWRHEAWFYRQLAAARDQFLAD